MGYYSDFHITIQDSKTGDIKTKEEHVDLLTSVCDWFQVNDSWLPDCGLGKYKAAITDVKWYQHEEDLAELSRVGLFIKCLITGEEFTDICVKYFCNGEVGYSEVHMSHEEMTIKDFQE